MQRTAAFGIPRRNRLAPLIITFMTAAAILTPLGPAFAGPETVIDGIPSGWARSVTFRLTVNDYHSGVPKIWYNLNGGNREKYEGPVTLTTDGISHLIYGSNDTLAYGGATAEVDIWIDSTPPATSIIGIPGGWVAPGSYSFSLLASDSHTSVASTYYRIDDGPIVLYGGGPVSVTASSGVAIDYWSTDTLGNTESVKRAVLKVDNGAPYTEISSLPVGWSASDVTFSLTGHAPAGTITGTVYRVGAGAAQTYSGPVTLTDEGVSTIAWRSTASVGGIEPTRTATIRIDKTPPVSSMSPVPSGWATGSVSFTLAASDSGSGVATRFFQLDSGPATMYDVPVTVSAPGTSTVRYWGVDAAGNVETPHTAFIRIDLGPSTSISSIMPGWHTSDVAFTLAGVSPSGRAVSTYYRLGAGPDVLYNGPAQVSGEGLTTITFHSVDALGYGDAVQTAQVMIDKTAPVSTITGIPSGAVAAPVTFRLSATDSGSGVSGLYYRLGAGAPVAFTGPVVVSGEGTTAVSWWAVDAAGNDEPRRSAAIVFDTAAPGTTVSGVPDGWSGSDVTFTLAGEPGARSPSAIRYRLGSGAETLYSSAVTVSGEGETLLSCRSVSEAGTVGPTHEATIRIDKTPPVTTYSAVSAVGPGASARFSLAAADALSGVATIRYQVDGAAAVSYTDTATVAGVGTHEVRYWSTDFAGNTETSRLAAIVVPAPLTLTRPRLSAPSPRRARAFVVRGSLAPVHATTTSVTLRFYRRIGSRFVAWRSVKASVRAGVTAYHVSYRIPARGRYAVRALHAAGGVSVASPYRYFVVR